MTAAPYNYSYIFKYIIIGEWDGLICHTGAGVTVNATLTVTVNATQTDDKESDKILCCLQERHDKVTEEEFRSFHQEPK